MNKESRVHYFCLLIFTQHVISTALRVFKKRLMKKDKMLGLIDLVLALLHVVVTLTSPLLDPCPCTVAIVVFGHTHRRVLEMPLVPFP
jgi:hypothetical protein